MGGWPVDASKRDTNPPRHSVHFFNDRPGDNGSQLAWLDYPLESRFRCRSQWLALDSSLREARNRWYVGGGVFRGVFDIIFDIHKVAFLFRVIHAV